MPLPTCPTQSTLRAFALGKLPGDRFEQLCDHVQECSDCQEQLQHFEQGSDELLSQLRQITNPVSGLLEIPGSGDDEQTTPHSSEIAWDRGLQLAHALAAGPCRLGKFELLRELGHGSFGYVFQGRDTELDRVVAIKVQRAGQLSSPEEFTRFKREARSVAQLQHPGIVALYEFGQTEDGVCYLVSEFVEGETLEQFFKRQPLDGSTSAELALQIANALQFAHEHGVVHRDLKPSNILLDEQRRPHLTDFGLAKRSQGEASMTSEGCVLGTPAYMSPEQARGDSHAVDARTDVYGLGVILYEMLTGIRPFQGDKRLLVLQVLEDDPRPPRLLHDQVPRDLETICLKAMAKSSSRRYQSASAMADDLRRFLAGQPIQARPLGSIERLGRWCRRNPLAASIMLAICLGSAAGFWYLASLSSYFVQATALDSTKMEMAMLEEINAYYSDVVDRVDQKKTPVTHEYTHRQNSLPLPATFLIDAGERISKTESGIHVRLYSDFPWRPNANLKDTFEQQALRELTQRNRQNSRELVYYEFTQLMGQPSLRYAKGQLMKETCVKCHNADTQSPKRDWREGDLAGVLTITRPVERDIARTATGLRGAFLLMGLIALVPLGLLLSIVFQTRVLTPFRQYWHVTARG